MADSSNKMKTDIKKMKNEAKEDFKKGIIQQEEKMPRSARKDAKRELKTSKKEFKLVRKDYKVDKSLLRKNKQLSNADIKVLNDKKLAFKKAVYQKKVQKKLYKQSVKNDTTLVRNQIKSGVKLRVKQDIKYKATSNIEEDDTLGEGIQQIRQAQTAKMNMRQSLRVVKQGGKLVLKTARGVYGLNNRTYNLIRGKGFYKTPPHLTARAEAMRKLRKSNRRLKAYANLKKNQSISNINKAVGSVKNIIATGVKLLVGNPITWLFLVVVMAIVAVLAAISSQQYAIVQDDKDLTDSWIEMTKIDAEHNGNLNTFFSNIDDVMFYMNYEHGDYAVTDNISFNRTYANYLSDLWTALNGKAPDYELSTMDDLIKKEKGEYYLEKEDYDDFKELKDEYGYASLDGQLSFPFKTEEMTITRRFGYEGDKNSLKLFEAIEVPCETENDILSPMDGEISRIPNDHSIEITLDEDYRIILDGVKSSRYKVGGLIKEGELIGQATSTTLEIKYFSYQAKDDTWEAINPAFYFPKVSYTQTTILASDYEIGELSPQVTALIPKFKQAMKEVGMPGKYLAVVLAVCMQESGGRVPDVMQASESLGLPPNTLGTDASIKQGVKYLWGNMKLVGIELVDKDEKYLRTAVQAYNYGVGFISYASSNNYAYTLELAVSFANKMSGGTGAYGDSKYIPHVWRYMSSNSQKNPGNGEFSYPISDRSANVSGFEYRINPVTLVAEFHKGLDFAVPLGTEVYASADGTVMRASDVNDGYGINIVVKHDNGSYWTRFAHLSKTVVSEGGKVKKGQVIGYVGSTGQSTGPHLHYEVLTSMYAGHVDPRNFIK